MLVPARANRASRSRHSLSFRERVPCAIAVLLEKKDFVNEIPPRYRSRQEWLWGALTLIRRYRPTPSDCAQIDCQTTTSMICTNFGSITSPLAGLGPPSTGWG